MIELVRTDAHEGPVWAPGALYFTTNRPEVQIRRFDLATGDVTTVREHTGVANGMTRDNGTLLVCEQAPAAITRVDPATGTVLETVVDAFDGKPLNSPNDVVVASDGADLVHRP